MGSLGKAIVPHLKFFTSIARRSKEKERKKKRPTAMFSSRVADDDVAVFVQAVCEFLDKWGRHYEAVAFPTSELQDIARARSDLLRDGIRLPSPDMYRTIDAEASGG